MGKKKKLSKENIYEAIKKKELLNADRQWHFGLEEKNQPKQPDGIELIPIEEFKLYWEANFKIVLKEEQINDLPWDETLYKLKKELNNKLRIAPTNSRVEILSKERKLSLEKVLMDERNHHSRHILSPVYHYILNGENPLVTKIAPIAEVILGGYKEIEIEGVRFYYLIYRMDDLKMVIHGIAFAHFVPYIDGKIKKLDGVNKQENLVNQSKEELEEETESKQDSVLTKQLLLISYLQENNLFPDISYRKGEPKSQIEKFISEFLNVKQETVKKGFQRVDNIKRNKKLTSQNASKRILYLNYISKNLLEMGLSDLSQKVDALSKHIVDVCKS